MCLVKDSKPSPKYEVKEILKKLSLIHSHEVLLLPPYVRDLNAIELVWSQAKRKFASKNMGLPASKMQNLIKVRFDSITAEHKEKYLTLETELERFIINDGDNGSEESSDVQSISSSGVLESDFDYDS
uniref:Tc1-like transposase DDE domain-containing protein n=1 Tax=Heliothis virescens TaxID=7102 RepID=A0A2A4JB38_HELVI